MNDSMLKVITWIEEKNLNDVSDSKTQILKLISAAGELSKSISNREDCRQDVGNCIVQILILSAINKYSIKQFIMGSDLANIDDNHDSISSFMYELWQGFGRLSKAISQEDDYRSTLDDLVIILSGIARFYNYSIEECLDIAYSDINDKEEGSA